VYVVLPADFLGSHAKWLRVVVMSALSAMYRNPEGEKVLFLLDEFAQLGYLGDLEKAAGLARGYGVQLWPFFQDFNQLKSLYSDRAETFLANAGITQVFTANDMTTAEYFSQRSGVKTAWRETVSGENTSYSEGKEPLFSPYEILGLDENQELIFKDGIGESILMWKTRNYFENPAFAGMYDADPYHKPQRAKSRPDATGAGDMAEAPA
jgi:type IV secretion system protein VirD4